MKASIFAAAQAAAVPPGPMDDLNNAAGPPLQLLPPLRRWQGEATVTTLAALAKQDHRYIQAPMGTGKTRVIFEISDSPAIVGTRTPNRRPR